MIDVRVGKRYAEAIYVLAEEKKRVKEVFTLLSNVMECYKNDLDFRDFITSPLLKYEEKKEILGNIFYQADKDELEMLFYILRKNRIDNIREIVAEFLKIYYTKKQILDVKAVFAKRLTKEQKKTLITNLSQKTGREVSLEVIVDEDILGGGILKIGDKILDGSIRKDLDKWKNTKS